VFAHACRLGAEGIVSKKVDSTYRSGPCRVWIKIRNPATIAVQRERSAMWTRRASGSARWRCPAARAKLNVGVLYEKLVGRIYGQQVQADIKWLGSCRRASAAA
jgi:hypothetical protein